MATPMIDPNDIVKNNAVIPDPTKPVAIPTQNTSDGLSAPEANKSIDSSWIGTGIPAPKTQPSFSGALDSLKTGNIGGAINQAA